jgi:hypothetical protein
VKELPSEFKIVKEVVEGYERISLILFSLSENPLVLSPLSIVLCVKGIFRAPIPGTLISKARDVLINEDGV